MSSTRRPVVSWAAAFIAAALAALGFAPPAGAAEQRSETAADRAVAYLATQQRADGGFGENESPAGDDISDAFSTPDVVLALAGAAQSTLSYDAVAARAAVRSVRKGGNDGLHYLDDVADSGETGGEAAKLVIPAAAVGLDPAKFDPDGDGPADLVAAIEAGRGSDGSYGLLGETLLVPVAHRLVGRTTDQQTLTFIRNGQRPDGGFNFSGSQTNGAFDDSDVDTTSRVVVALVAAGVDATDATITRALAFLAKAQHADGGFGFPGGSPSNVNTTAVANLGIEAAGYDLESACWRVANGGTRTGYISPDNFLRAQQRSDGSIAEPDAFDLVFATAQSVQGLLRNFEPIRRSRPQPCETTGYRLVASDGGVFAEGASSFEGSTGALTLNQPIVASASTPTGKGYWLFASDGGVFAFGDAVFFGSTGDLTLNKPIVGAAATPTGGGYWLFASDGGVFAFGDAAFLDSLGALVLNKPIVAGASTPSGRGYWLFASDGGVFTFGDAEFFGSTGDVVLNKPVVAGIASLGGKGYLLVATDGGVFTFGDAVFHGSTGDLTLNKPIVTALRSGGTGYYLVASDGGVFAMGAPFLGSEGDRSLNKPIVAAAL